jgi:hypothetical protein
MKTVIDFIKRVTNHPQVYQLYYFSALVSMISMSEQEIIEKTKRAELLSVL